MQNFLKHLGSSSGQPVNTSVETKLILYVFGVKPIVKKNKSFNLICLFNHMCQNKLKS